MPPRSKGLILGHLWAAFVLFGAACVLGAWQMWVRSPLPGAPLGTPANYYLSVTAHGTVMAYAVTTFFAMGFGYAIAEAALGRLPGRRWAWAAFVTALGGLVLALVPVFEGRASVLYTFYPPLTADPRYYAGVLLVVLASWVWAALMVLSLRAWRRGHPGEASPLALFAIAATAILWLWTSAGMAAEVVGMVLPAALGWTPAIDVGLGRTLFSWTLHGIVYFWLLPAYIALYAMLPQAAGARLYSDRAGRLTFVLFVVFALPVGLHHLFADPEHGSGFKYLQTVLTALVAAPTLLTAFTITATLERAGRARGGRGLLGWIPRLPWERPMVLAVGLALVMLGLGGFGGLVNMSYAMNSMIHNTHWVTAHFHLIFGGATVILYMAVAYELWPRLTGNALASPGLVRLQLWSWFLGMLLTTLPWHVAGLMGQPRRMATYDYASPEGLAQAPWVVASVVGGAVLLASALLFVGLLAANHLHRPAAARPVAFAGGPAFAAAPGGRVPAALNGFALWNAVLLGLMLLAYGWPVAQSFVLPTRPAPVVSAVGR